MSGRRLTVVVSSFDDAARAVAVGNALGAPLTLLSAPGAAAYAGCGWFAGLQDAAQAAANGQVEWALDCGDRAGDALEALAAGCRAVVFTGGDGAAARLSDIAAARGARVLRTRPAAITLRAGGDPVAAARDWLSLLR